MPASASIEAYRRHGLDYVPGSGLLAATVPGAFGAWMRLLDEYGTLPARTVMEPAIHYASTGAPLLPKAAEMIAAVQPVFSEHWQESARVYLDRDGRAPRAGQRWCNPDLAGTYSRLLSEGEAGGGSREAVIRATSRGLLPRVRRRDDRRLRVAQRGPRCHRGGPCRVSHRARPQPLVRGGGGDCLAGLPRSGRPQGRPVVTGTDLPAAARAARRPRSRRLPRCRASAPRHRGGQAGACRPRGLVRGPALHRGRHGPACSTPPTTRSAGR